LGIDPISLTATALIAIGVPTATAATIAPYVLAAAAVAGSVAVSAALAPNLPAPDPAKAAKQATTIEGGPRYHLIGRGVLGGRYLLSRSKGKYDLHRILAHCMGEIDGIEEYRVNNRLVALGSDSTVKTEPYRGVVQIRSRLGTDDQMVFGATNAAFGGRWPSTARGLGEVLTELICTSPGFNDPDHAEIYSAGWPDLQILARGPRVYDPRLGDDPADPDCRRWTPNGPLHVLDHMLRSRKKGGWETPIGIWDIDDIAAFAAPAAEAARALKGGGTEWRLRAGGVQDCGPGVPLIDTLRDLLLSTGCDILRTKTGRYTIRPIEDEPSPTAVLPWAAILPNSVMPLGPRSAERPTRYTLEYFSSERDYEEAEADVTGLGWAEDIDEIARTGERTEPITLRYCPSVGQASRIGRMIARMRRQPRATYVCDLRGLALAGHGEALIEDQDLGGPIPVVLRSVVTDFAAGTVTVDVVEKPILDAYDPEIHQADPPATRDEVPDASAPGEPTIEKAILVRTGWGGTRAWAVRVRMDYGGGDDRDQQVIFAPSTDDGFTWAAWQPLDRLTSAFADAGAYMQSPSVVDMSAAKLAASSARSTHDVSAWVFDEIRYEPPNAPPSAPAAPLVTDNGDGTSTYTWSSDFSVAYWIVTNASGSIAAQGDAARDGSFSASLTTAAYTAVAYDSDDRASS
jgi:hypothetical protein